MQRIMTSVEHITSDPYLLNNVRHYSYSLSSIMHYSALSNATYNHLHLGTIAIPFIQMSLISNHDRGENVG